MEKRIIVCGIIVNKDKILLGKKRKGKPPYPDVWHTIGGGVEDIDKADILLKEHDYDNNYFHAELSREIKEEANIKLTNIKNICPKYRKTPREATTKNKEGVDTHYIFLEYICDYDSGELRPGDDIAELIWIKKSELKNMKLTPPSMEMYKELGWI